MNITETKTTVTCKPEWGVLGYFCDLEDAFVSVSCRHEYRVDFSLNFTVAVALAAVSIL